MNLNTIIRDNSKLRLQVKQEAASVPNLPSKLLNILNTEVSSIKSGHLGVENIPVYYTDNPFPRDTLGWYVVVRTVEERDKISCCDRLPNMVVLVVGDDLSFKEYSLQGDNICEDPHWVEITDKDFDVILTENYSNLDLTTEIKTQKDLNNVLIKILTELQTLQGDKHFIFDQFDAKSTWTITHNMNKFPSVYTVDTANSVVEGLVEYIDKNSLIVTFNFPFSGKAYLN